MRRRGVPREAATDSASTSEPEIPSEANHSAAAAATLPTRRGTGLRPVRVGGSRGRVPGLRRVHRRHRRAPVVPGDQRESEARREGRRGGGGGGKDRGRRALRWRGARAAAAAVAAPPPPPPPGRPRGRPPRGRGARRGGRRAGSPARRRDVARAPGAAPVTGGRGERRGDARRAREDERRNRGGDAASERSRVVNGLSPFDVNRRLSRRLRVLSPSRTRAAFVFVSFGARRREGRFDRAEKGAPLLPFPSRHHPSPLPSRSPGSSLPSLNWSLTRRGSIPGSLRRSPRPSGRGSRPRR